MACGGGSIPGAADLGLAEATAPTACSAEDAAAAIGLSRRGVERGGEAVAMATMRTRAEGGSALYALAVASAKGARRRKRGGGGGEHEATRPPAASAASSRRRGDLGRGLGGVERREAVRAWGLCTEEVWVPLVRRGRRPHQVTGPQRRAWTGCRCGSASLGSIDDGARPLVLDGPDPLAWAGPVTSRVQERLSLFFTAQWRGGELAGSEDSAQTKGG